VRLRSGPTGTSGPQCRADWPAGQVIYQHPCCQTPVRPGARGPAGARATM